jgi:hypothetical protein
VTSFAGTATFSPCERYRYTLRREWPQLRVEPTDHLQVAFIMLNPSTATADVDDPTVAKCGRFARAWDADQLLVVNLFAWRATDPRDMKAAADPVGPMNDEAIRMAVRDSSIVVCAWGNHGSHLARSAQVISMLRHDGLGDRLKYLKLNKSGEPQHPLYLSEKLAPQRWWNNHGA